MQILEQTSFCPWTSRYWQLGGGCPHTPPGNTHALPFRWHTGKFLHQARWNRVLRASGQGSCSKFGLLALVHRGSAWDASSSLVVWVHPLGVTYKVPPQALHLSRQSRRPSDPVPDHTWLPVRQWSWQTPGLQLGQKLPGSPLPHTEWSP